MPLWSTLQAAARAYDVARICALGPAASHLNFPAAQYAAQMQTLSHLSLEVLSKHLRAYGLGTQAGRPTSHYLGVRHHTRAKRWEAIIRMGRRQVSLGLYDSDVAAAEAYDQAAILRHMQGLAAGGLATSLPSLNFNSDHYSCLVDDGEQEQASATSAAGKYVAESACRRPDMLQSRYITAVLDACAEYLKALESENAVGSAEAAGEGPGVREAALAAATMPGDPVRA